MPAAPTNLSATFSGAGAVLTWTASPGAASYSVKASWPSGGPYTTIGSVVSPTFTDLDLTSGQTIHYVVTAYSACGVQSATSNEASATSTSPAPPRTLPPPPRDPGCYVRTSNGWQVIPCTPNDQLADPFKTPPQGSSQEYSSICAGPAITNPSDPNSPCLNKYPDGAWAFAPTRSIQFGQVDSTMVSVNGEKELQTNTLNTLSLQANTNVFSGVDNHVAWVQFVVMSDGGSEEIGICIWQIDYSMNPPDATSPGGGKADAAFPGDDARPPTGDYYTHTRCVGGKNGTGISPNGMEIPKRAGAYKPMDFATVAGSTYKDSTGQDVLGMVAQLSWATPDPNYPTTNLYSIVQPDALGLAGKWSNLSGDLLGKGGGTQAVFTPPALVTTRLLAGSCLNGPGPVSGIPWPGNCPEQSPFLPFTTIGQDGQTSETNNLIGLPPVGPTSSAMTPETVYTEFWESTDANCPTKLDPHVYVRDSYEDTGATPSNIGGQPFWESPDIFLVEHDTPVWPENESIETLVSPGTQYDIWVRVNNDLGCDDVTGVEALVYVADPSAGLASQETQVTGGIYSGGPGYPFGMTVKKHSQALLGPFTFVAPTSNVGNGHKCIITAIEADNELPVNSTAVWDAPDSYQVAQRNIQFSDCAYPLTNTSSTPGSLTMTLSVTPIEVVNPPVSGGAASDIEFSVDDWSKAWYGAWSTQLANQPAGSAQSFAISHDDPSGQTIITLVAASVGLAAVTLDANSSPVFRVTKLDAYVAGQMVQATLAVQTTITLVGDGGTKTINNGGSCRTPIPD